MWAKVDKDYKEEIKPVALSYQDLDSLLQQPLAYSDWSTLTENISAYFKAAT